jgi:hypothetical protein
MNSPPSWKMSDLDVGGQRRGEAGGRLAMWGARDLVLELRSRGT